MMLCALSYSWCVWIIGVVGGKRRGDVTVNKRDWVGGGRKEVIGEGRKTMHGKKRKRGR